MGGPLHYLEKIINHLFSCLLVFRGRKRKSLASPRKHMAANRHRLIFTNIAPLLINMSHVSHPGVLLPQLDAKTELEALSRAPDSPPGPASALSPNPGGSAWPGCCPCRKPKRGARSTAREGEGSLMQVMSAGAPEGRARASVAGHVSWGWKAWGLRGPVGEWAAGDGGESPRSCAEVGQVCSLGCIV